MALGNPWVTQRLCIQLEALRVANGNPYTCVTRRMDMRRETTDPSLIKPDYLMQTLVYRLRGQQNAKPGITVSGPRRRESAGSAPAQPQGLIVTATAKDSLLPRR
jgi:hypothetical protein